MPFSFNLFTDLTPTHKFFSSNMIVRAVGVANNLYINNIYYLFV